MSTRRGGRGRQKKWYSMGSWVFLASLGSVLLAAYGMFAGYRFLHEEFPDVSVLKTRYPVVRFLPAADESDDDDMDEVTIELVRARPASWVALSEVSSVATGAILVSEDWAFYQHKGYDPNQMKEALREDWHAGRFARGASTITQQVVRNVFLDKDKNLWRKLKELYLSVRLEESVGKRKILETYLNVAEWGRGVYGIRAAARTYFNKEPRDLTAKEGAFLAMLLPSPRRYSQSFRKRVLTDYARQTVDDILDKMARAHYLSEEQRDSEARTPLSFEVPLQSSM